jgi:predicted RNase H-like HicB family nuclease
MKKFEHTTREGSLGTEIYVQDPSVGGYTAFLSDFPEIVTEGETIEEAQQNLWNTIFDVLKYYLSKQKH